MSYKRIAIIGPGGSGKSTLARRLGERIGLPVTHLDRVIWRADWTRTPWKEFETKLNELALNDQWILDGNMKNSDIRWQRAELIILMDFSPLLCLKKSI